jgi:hypothetical protein
MTASDAGRDHYDNGERILAELVQEHVQVDNDVIEINEATWAIHGYVAYDGEVIAATFASGKEAWAGLSRLEEIARDYPPERQPQHDPRRGARREPCRGTWNALG